ncbi:hypothetical protein [Humisphaera borealis]|uniref:Uncharacterized protein n=1 Tax=Humisphaera borealis TaxID=2807512 RepID=A0A7M2WVA0_9BACT|nr:hypothetical protein [Humisphaera borealis]QOV89386.1 hypothetical protein IPV69_24820 [Humisphaera borealis]
MNKPDAPFLPPNLLWIGIGAAVLVFVCVQTNMSPGMFIYLGIGMVVAGYWFWRDKAPDSGGRSDIAAAFPFLAMFWPLLVVALLFGKEFGGPR